MTDVTNECFAEGGGWGVHFLKGIKRMARKNSFKPNYKSAAQKPKSLYQYIFSILTPALHNIYFNYFKNNLLLIFCIIVLKCPCFSLAFSIDEPKLFRSKQT